MDDSFYKKMKERKEKMRQQNNIDVTRQYRLKTSNVTKLPIRQEAEVITFKPLQPPLVVDVQEQNVHGNLTLQQRLERIKTSVDRINELMQELKSRQTYKNE